MREKQQDTVLRNAQYYKPIISRFEVGSGFLIIPGTCDKKIIVVWAFQDYQDDSSSSS